MSLPHLVLVDDSEAILAYEKAALAAHYALSTANNGQDALKKIQEIRPAGILLDLSMPVMDGETVLSKLKANPDLRDIPVIVISSEKARAEACVKQGAAAYLPKPIRADELRALVGRVLEDAKRHEQRGSLAVLFVGVGTLEMGIPLDYVRTVVQQPATRPFAVGPFYMKEMFDYYGTPVCIIDMARRFGVVHSEALIERKLVVLTSDQQLISLCVDWVRDPAEYRPEDIIGREQIGGTDHKPVQDVLRAVVKTDRGPMPIIEPKILLSDRMLRHLPEALESARKQVSGTAQPRA